MKYGFKGLRGCIISNNKKNLIILYTVPAERYLEDKIFNTKCQKCSDAALWM